MDIFKTDAPIDLGEHMVATYQTLRVVLFVIALLFPLVLWIGGCISDDRLKLQGSMSIYYHANEELARVLAEPESEERKLKLERLQADSGRGVMRDWFVGVLFAIGALLAAYKGYRPAEDLALNLAAVLVVLVALFPTSLVESGSLYHGAFAVSFFLCIAYVCIFCASATLPLVRDDNRRAHYHRLYKLFGFVMVASPLVASVLNWTLGGGRSFIFFAEASGVYAFAFYWLVKTREISETNADRRATSGELQLQQGTGPSDALRELPVTRAKRPNATATVREALEP